MQMQQAAQVAVCVDSIRRTIEVWGPTRQVLALALYVGEKVRRSRGMAGDWDPDTELHRVRKVLDVLDYGGARGRTKGHTAHVVYPQASATGAADQGFNNLVQDGLTWWVVESRGDRHGAVVHTAAPLKRVEHPLMRWVPEAEEVRVERAEEMRTRTILRALESQMGKGAEAREAGDIKDEIWLVLEWVDGYKEGDKPRWIVRPGTEEGARREALARARKFMEDVRKQGLEVEEDPQGGRQGGWRGTRTARGGQMRFLVGDTNEEEQGGEKEGQAKEEEGREPGAEADPQLEKDLGAKGKD